MKNTPVVLDACMFSKLFLAEPDRDQDIAVDYYRTAPSALLLSWTITDVLYLTLKLNL